MLSESAQGVRTSRRAPVHSSIMVASVPTRQLVRTASVLQPLLRILMLPCMCSHPVGTHAAAVAVPNLLGAVSCTCSKLGKMLQLQPADSSLRLQLSHPGPFC